MPSPAFRRVRCANIVPANGLPLSAFPAIGAKIKKRPKKNILLETSKCNTRGTTQIAAFAAPSDSSKSYPLTRANGCTWDRGSSAHRLGSDGSFGAELSACTNR